MRSLDQEHACPEYALGMGVKAQRQQFVDSLFGVGDGLIPKGG